MNESTMARKQSLVKKTLLVDSIICLIAGLGIGAVAIAGPMAVWLGIADFRFGFGLLQFVNTWSIWIAGGALIIAIAIVVIGMLMKVEGATRLGAFALIGAVSAGLAYYIPETFRPAEGTPAIHDIATDPYRPLQFEAIAPLRANAANNMDYGVMEGVTPREHIQLQLEAYPDIEPQRFEDSVEEVFNRAMAAIDQLGWEVVHADVNEGRIEATDTTFWFRFKDDVVIEITTDTRDTILNARSTSRVGRSDVGKNAARLREFFSLLR
ncbi:MAG: DUF1499 domain-containing protein [Gammaproteobacteria bacterium]